MDQIALPEHLPAGLRAGLRFPKAKNRCPPNWTLIMSGADTDSTVEKESRGHW
jgi:hypothetical protein